MKKTLLALTAAALLTIAGTASALQARGWRITFEQTIANDTPIVISEIEWLHYASHDIDSVTTGIGGTFSLAATDGDATADFADGSTFTVSDSTGNDGTYTVASADFTTVTTITVEEEITDSTADGTITTDSLVDGTRADLGKSECGWTRDVSTLPGGTKRTHVPVACDSVAVNRAASSTINVGPDTRRTRLGARMFDNIETSTFETAEPIGTNGPFIVQYTWYTGASAPGRVLPDVTAYTVSVPIDEINPINGKAPSIWYVEYLDKDVGRWVRFEDSEVSAANFRDGDDVTASPTSTTVIGKKLFTLLP